MSKKINEQGRHVGIELLRIVSMLMVVSLHFFDKGNYDESSNLIINIESWFMICLSIVAVNCYVLIGSYFLSEKAFKLSRLTNVYVVTWFYSFFTFIVTTLLKINIFSLGDFARSIMPFTFKNYWFVNTYLLLLCISPLLNSAINNMDQRKFKLVLSSIVGIFCVLNYIMKPFGPIDDTAGFGVLWFIVLYMTAAYIKKYYISSGRWYIFLLGYLLVSLLNLVLRFALMDKGEVFSDGMVREYNNIFTYLSSVLLFMTFINIKINIRVLVKVISFISPLTFGVYLIHESRSIKEHLWNVINIDTWCVENWMFIFLAIGTILFIFLLCCTIELVRLKIFEMLKINKLINSVSNKIESKLRALVLLLI